jgi:hypothetical protein
VANARMQLEEQEDLLQGVEVRAAGLAGAHRAARPRCSLLSRVTSG